ncbi:MAG TPA: type IV pilus assembly protein PilM [Gaiellaceae bacterium]|nr:type IV pilus assembly protein PilM [Gaiellaceae bacterium]
MPEQTSIWKKEISFGRRRSKVPATTAPVATVAPPPPPRVEQNGAVVHETDARVVNAREVVLAARAAVEKEQTPAPAQPWWKKEIGVGRPGKAKGAPQPGKPMLKRDVRFSLPKLSAGSRAGTKLVGLRIGSSQLAAAVVSNNGSAEVQKLARASLAPGVVSAGEVRDPEALGQALKRFFVAYGLPRRNIRLGVATNRIGVRVIEVPAVDDPKLLGNAIRFKAQEVLPFPLTEAVLDHVILGETVDTEDGPLQRVLVVFAQRELVDAYIDACKRAGLKLTGIDFDAFALLRALADQHPTPGANHSALVAVSIGHDRTIFAVSDGTTCEFARVLDWGGANIDRAIASALGISPEAAAQVKESLAAEDEATEPARQALHGELQVLARELLSSLQFYQSRPGSLDLSEVLLTGGVSQLAGIDDELRRQLGVPVRIGDPLHAVKEAGKLHKPSRLASLAIAVGLGIET